MRGWLAVMAVLAAGTARADLVADCTQTEDWWLRISACTEAIESGRWVGERAAWAYSNRAVAHATLGNYIEAFDDHAQAVRLNPGDARARNSKANSHAEFREYERALKEYDAAISLDPGYLNAYFNRADLLLRIERFAAAEADFTRVLQGEPGFGPARAGRAAARCGTGDVAGSVEDRLAAVELGVLTGEELAGYLRRKGYLRGDAPAQPAFEAALEEWTRAGCP